MPPYRLTVAPPPQGERVGVRAIQAIPTASFHGEKMHTTQA